MGKRQRRRERERLWRKLPNESQLDFYIRRTEEEIFQEREEHERGWL